MKLFEAIGAEYSCVPVRNTCWHAGQPAMRLDDSHSSGAFVWCHNGTPVEFQAAWLTDDTWERVEDRPEADVPTRKELKAAMKEARADLLDELYDYHQSDKWCNAPLAVRIYYKVYQDSCSQLEDAE